MHLLAHSLSTGRVFSRYRPKIYFFYIISVKWLKCFNLILRKYIFTELEIKKHWVKNEKLQFEHLKLCSFQGGILLIKGKHEIIIIIYKIKLQYEKKVDYPRL